MSVDRLWPFVREYNLAFPAHRMPFQTDLWAVGGGNAASLKSALIQAVVLGQPITDWRQFELMTAAAREAQHAAATAYAAFMGGGASLFPEKLATDCEYRSKHFRAAGRSEVLALLNERRSGRSEQRVGTLRLDGDRCCPCAYSLNSSGQPSAITTFTVEAGKVCEISTQGAGGWYQLEGDSLVPTKLDAVQASDLEGNAEIQKVRRAMASAFGAKLSED